MYASLNLFRYKYPKGHGTHILVSTTTTLGSDSHPRLNMSQALLTLGR